MGHAIVVNTFGVPVKGHLHAGYDFRQFFRAARMDIGIVDMHDAVAA